MRLSIQHTRRRDVVSCVGVIPTLLAPSAIYPRVGMVPVRYRGPPIYAGRQNVAES